MKQITLTLTTLLISSLVMSQTFELIKIKDSGPDDERINFLIMGDGYTESELDKFESDATDLTDFIFSDGLFGQYQAFFNVYGIKVPSSQSGASHPGTASDESSSNSQPITNVNNYFGSTFDYAGVHRLLVPVNSNAVYSVAADNYPGYDQIFILVNSTYYGGSGGALATSSTNSSAGEVAVHEIGHSFGFLADEYENPGSSPREAPNATAQTERSMIRWNHWIEESTPIPTPETETYREVVGLFEGAVYNPTGWYRPKLDCKMRSLGQPFCEVCSEAFILRFYDFINPIGTTSPSSSEVTISGTSNEVFDIQLLGEELIDYDITWSVNGEEIFADLTQIEIVFDDSQQQTNTVEVVITDNSKVKKEVIQFSHSWTVIGNLEGAVYKPSMSEFDPVKGTAGDVITINGANFNESYESISLTVGGIPVDIQSIANNQIEFIVPNEDLDGTIILSIDGQNDTTETHFKTVPSITEFSPLEGFEGDTINIAGTNFSAIDTDNAVTLGGIAASVIEVTHTHIDFEVPENASSAFISVRVNGESTVASVRFEVTVIAANSAALDKKIRIFPNPSSHIVNIEIPQEIADKNLQIEIFDLNGKLVSSGLEYSPPGFTMSVEDINPGHYIMIINAGGLEYMKRLLVE